MVSAWCLLACCLNRLMDSSTIRCHTWKNWAGYSKRVFRKHLNLESPYPYHHIVTAFVAATVNTPSLVVRLLPVRLLDFLWRISSSQATQSRNYYRIFSARKWLLLMIGLSFGACEVCWVLSAVTWLCWEGIEILLYLLLATLRCSRSHPAGF